MGRLFCVLCPSMWLLALGQAGAAELFFNSYGWSDIYRYDTVTGQTTLLPATDIFDTGFCSSATFGPDGALYGGTASDLHRIVFSGGQALWTDWLTLDHFASDGIAFDSQNRLYTASNHTVRRVSSTGQTESAVTVT